MRLFKELNTRMVFVWKSGDTRQHYIFLYNQINKMKVEDQGV